MELLIYELPQAQAGIAAPVFKGIWFDEAYIDSFFEGRQEGRIFVDNPRKPTAALLCRTFEYYIAGNAGSLALRQFIKDAPAEVGVFQDLYGYAPVGEAWKQAVLADHAGQFEVIERRGFKFHKPAIDDWRRFLPPGAEVKRIDRALAERIDTELGQLIGLFWNGYEPFISGGFGFCMLLDGAIASVAYAISVSAAQANIGVETAEPLRKRGLATLTCSAFIEHCLAQGLTPTWDTDAVNAGSLATARKLGFQEYPPFSEVYPPGRGKLMLSHGRWTKEDHPTSAPEQITIWRRLEQLEAS